MNRIRKRTYRGIEYIRLSDLSDELNTEIRNWLSDDVLIKIKTDKGIERDCIQIKDFLYWFKNLYTSVKTTKETESAERILNSASAYSLSLES